MNKVREIIIKSNKVIRDVNRLRNLEVNNE